MSRDRFSLEGRTALVTGASRGLGRAMALGLAEAGASVVCVSSQPGGVLETAEAIRKLGRTAWELSCDVSDRQQLAVLADDAERAAGDIEILVNNAGTIRRKQQSTIRWKIGTQFSEPISIRFSFSRRDSGKRWSSAGMARSSTLPRSWHSAVESQYPPTRQASMRLQALPKRSRTSGQHQTYRSTQLLPAISKPTTPKHSAKTRHDRARYSLASRRTVGGSQTTSQAPPSFLLRQPATT